MKLCYTRLWDKAASQLITIRMSDGKLSNLSVNIIIFKKLCSGLERERHRFLANILFYKRIKFLNKKFVIYLALNNKSVFELRPKNFHIKLFNVYTKDNVHRLSFLLSRFNKRETPPFIIILILHTFQQLGFLINGTKKLHNTINCGIVFFLFSMAVYNINTFPHILRY